MRIVVVFHLLFAFISVHAQQIPDTVLTIYFDSDVSQLDSLQIKNIQSFTSYVAKVDKVVGYTDTVGSTEYNLHLSKLRALNAYNLVHSFHKELTGNTLYNGENFQQAVELNKNRKVEIYGYKRRQELTNNNQTDSIIEVLELENIYFVPDKPIIIQQSIPYVNILAGRLKLYKNVRFEIVGHVNYQSRKEGEFILQDLFRLSEQRAKLIYELFIDNGISADKLSYKGVGNSKPVIKDPQNDDERKRNMRVQVFVISLPQTYMEPRL
jgi:outer membrane protein OmpA-like peptidoglycan-associated protein